MTRPSRCDINNTRIAQEPWDNRTGHLVEQDKLRPDKGQWGMGDNFPESGTVPLKAGRLDSLYFLSMKQDHNIHTFLLTWRYGPGSMVAYH